MTKIPDKVLEFSVAKQEQTPAQAPVLEVSAQSYSSGRNSGDACRHWGKKELKMSTGNRRTRPLASSPILLCFARPRTSPVCLNGKRNDPKSVFWWTGIHFGFSGIQHYRLSISLIFSLKFQQNNLSSVQKLTSLNLIFFLFRTKFQSY